MAQIELDMIWHNPPVQFDAGCVEAIDKATRQLGYPYRKMVSGAGHDACQLARKVPTAMVFVPRRDVLSHNEAEWAEPDHLTAGANVLLHAVLDLSRRAASVASLDDQCADPVHKNPLYEKEFTE